MAVNDQILEYIKTQGKASPVQLSNALKISRSAVTKGLAVLAAQGQLMKTLEGRDAFYEIKKSPVEIIPEAKPIVPNEASPSPQSIPIEQPQEIKVSSSPPAPPANQGPLEFWCTKLKVDQEWVESWHYEMYSWAFNNPYGVYRIPFGLMGRFMDIGLWILAIGILWIWKSKGLIFKLILLLFVSSLLMGAYFIWKKVEHQAILPVSKDMQLLDQRNKVSSNEQQENKELNQQLVIVQKELEGKEQKIAQLQEHFDQSKVQYFNEQQKNKELTQQLVILQKELETKSQKSIQLQEELHKESTQHDSQKSQWENKLKAMARLALPLEKQSVGTSLIHDLSVIFDENGERVR